MELVYPPYLLYRETFVPTSYEYDDKNKRLVKHHGTEVNRKNTYYNQLYKSIDTIYDVKKTILTTGTILYRCSTSRDPYEFMTSATGSPLIYFGLDFVISVWIALEINDRTKPKHIPCFLHTYILNKDVKYKYIRQSEGTIPEIAPKMSMKMVCIHPQPVLHGSTVVDYEDTELGTELTFPRHIHFASFITHIKTFKIDVAKLHRNRHKMIFQWNPIKALTPLTS